MATVRMRDILDSFHNIFQPKNLLSLNQTFWSSDGKGAFKIEGTLEGGDGHRKVLLDLHFNFWVNVCLSICLSVAICV